eukprot:TRINITY_DN4657_c0_g1_i1.p1 TRINITY_DN4657_c0_g1~~TRINITY_DN4657_c0_g1_i1.p1  ORF type:complete len:174 (+),score=12.62 TRINITY_DN4657_c0_g1_i1:235-756(+)
MKPQTCCCHVCKTSLNQYKREFLPCTQCNKIVCRNCFGTKFRGPSWDESNANRELWICPSCAGTCACPRCKNKKATSPSKSLGVSSEDMKLSRSSSSECELLEKKSSKALKVMQSQLEELIDTERRCDTNIQAMEKMLEIMRREKDEIAAERAKLESWTEIPMEQVIKAEVAN